jgi:hypothetical protein
LNHDCRPNAHYYFDRETLTHHVHATRSILPGEELTISYIDPARSKEDRQRSLKQWGFECTCSLCSASPAVSGASDQRIAKILEIEEQLEQRHVEGETAISMAQLLISLYKQEGMDAPIASAYSTAAIEYNGVGKSWIASKYAKLAIETDVLYSGPSSESVAEMEILLKDPEGHWSWMAHLAGTYRGQDVRGSSL